MRENAPAFVKDRLLYINNEVKLKFFNTLRDLETDGDNECQLEMLKISKEASSKLKSGRFSCEDTKLKLADLILVGLNKNSQYISAIAPNYRRTQKPAMTKAAAITTVI